MGRAASYFTVFRNRVLLVVLISALCSQAGIWIRYYAVMMDVIDRTNSNPVALSLLTVAEFAPVLVFGFLGGTFADRWPPKRKLIACDLLNAASTFAVFAAFSAGWWQAVYFTPLVYASLLQFSQPAGLRLLKSHLERDKLQTGLSVYQTVFSVFILLGPILGTFVFQTFGVRTAILLMSVMFLLSATVQTRLPADRERKEESEPVLSQMKKGLRYLLSKSVFKRLSLAMMAAYMGTGLASAMQVFLVTERLYLGSEWLQWLLTVSGAGTITGGLLVMLTAKKMRPSLLMATGMVCTASALIVSVWSDELWLTLLAQFVVGLMVPLIQISFNTQILQYSQPSHIGRINGIMTPLYTASMLIGSGMAGVLKTHLSLVGVYCIAAGLLVMAFICIVPVSVREFSSLENEQR